jgi:thiamine pyrophosphate-dependent acetolactate synthase large subunit-like protein
VCGNFPRTRPLHAGSDIGPWMDEADLILLVNCRAPFYPPSRRPSKARIIVIDEVPQRPHVVYQVLFAERYLEGDVANTLRQLTKRAKAGRTDEAAVAAVTARRCAQEERHADEQAALAATEAKAAGAEGIDPVLVAATLRGLLDGRDAIVVDETITHSRVVKRHVQTSDPDSYFYVQGGLGQGIAVALGVKLAARERPVVLTIGDGAFAYNPVIPSYDAAKAYDLPLLIVVFNNRVYKSMNLNHRRFYPEGAAAETGEWLGTDLHRLPRLAQFAEPFGMHTETVEAPDALAPALERALKAVAEGTTATDPEKAVMPLPLGGAKGSGMSLAFELLTSVLVGAPIFAAFHSDDPQGRMHRQNALITAIDPVAFGDADAFTAAVDATLGTLKGLAAADGVEGVFYPGERSAAVGVRRAEKGVPVTAKVWRELMENADKLGITPPEARSQG